MWTINRAGELLLSVGGLAFVAGLGAFGLLGEAGGAAPAAAAGWAAGGGFLLGAAGFALMLFADAQARSLPRDTPGAAAWRRVAAAVLAQGSGPAAVADRVERMAAYVGEVEAENRRYEALFGRMSAAVAGHDSPWLAPEALAERVTADLAAGPTGGRR